MSNTLLPPGGPYGGPARALPLLPPGGPYGGMGVAGPTAIAATVLRTDPATGLTSAVATGLPLAVQVDQARLVEELDAKYAPEGAAYQPYTLYTSWAPGTPYVPGGVQVGDRLLDPTTGLAYVVLLVMPWGYHDEYSCLYVVPAAALAALNATLLGQFLGTITRLPHISEDTPGAWRTASYDPLLGQSTAFETAFETGWAAPDPQSGATRTGWLAAQTILAGINEQSLAEEMRPEGLVIYQGVLLYFLPATPIGKFDLIVRSSDGARFIVGDLVQPLQVYGQTTLLRAKLERRTTTDPVYAIPLV